MIEGERWLPVVGYEGTYEVSDQGRVRSLNRMVLMSNGVLRRTRGKLLTGGLAGRTRKHLAVPLSRDGTTKSRTIHQLVTEAFHGPAPTPAHEVRHLNGKHTDNRASNLQWGTRSENAFDTVSHGSNVNANKTRCKWGHLLVAPNIDNHRRTPGQRPCRACIRGWSNRIKRTRRGNTPLDFLTLANAAYERIMAGVDYR